MKNYFKPAVFLLSLWPIYIITYQLIYNKLGPEPVDRIVNHFGEWTLIFVLLTLSMTPLKKITNSLEWIKFRRMLGLFAFFYASVHMLSYVGLDYRFDFEPLIDDVLKKTLETIKENTQFSLKLMKNISHQLNDANTAISQMAQKPVKDRLAETLLQLEETFGDIIDKEIELIQ